VTQSRTNVVQPYADIVDTLSIHIDRISDAERALGTLDAYLRSIHADLQTMRDAIDHVRRYALDMSDRAQMAEAENGSLKKEIQRRAMLTDVKRSV